MEEYQALSEGEPLWSILARTADLLETDPVKAGQAAEAALRVAPGQQQALQLLVAARRAQGDVAGARTALESMATETPRLASVHYELGLLFTEAGDNEAAVRALSRAVELEPAHPQAWRAIGDALIRTGDMSGAADAYAKQFASSNLDLKTLEQVSAVEPDQVHEAQNVLREYLNTCPTDLMAVQMLGRMYMRANLFEPAEKVFVHALGVDPGFRAARLDHASALRQQMKYAEEIRDLDILLESEPDNPDYRRMRVTALSAAGRTAEAVQYCEGLIGAEPQRPEFRLALAYALRTVGHQDGCIAAFREAVRLDPGFGEAWWGLANLKTFRFSPEDLECMRHQLAREDIAEESRQYLHFALGKALEDSGDYRHAFAHYSRGNVLIRAKHPFDAAEIDRNIAREKQRFTPEFFRARENQGCPSTAPIFILGLPRSGSTLVEQILASHSSVEGAGELPCINAIVLRLETNLTARTETAGDDAAVLFADEDPRALGEEYLERCRMHRKLGRAFFTDKMPNNFHHLGVIATILPNAKIIDVRRHPLACCFSNFKQIFPSRQGASYDIADIGRYYRGYVELMAHFDRVLPGRVHRVVYENLVTDPEHEIRRLLDYCGLPFEENCLRFHETERGIRTISSEQVRLPVYTDSLEQWRHFEPWLEPLKMALGPVLDSYPATPEGF